MTRAQGHPLRRLAEIDGLRGLAALSVLLYHAWLYTRPKVIGARADGLWQPAVHELRLGLVLFFVLSGFLLYGPWVGAALAGERRPRLGSYLWHRAARIVPAYYVALLGSIALLWGLGAAEGVRLPHPGELPLFFIFAQNYSNGPLMSLDPPMWTLCVEVSYYVLLPLVGWLAWAVGGGRRHQAVLPLALLVAERL
jgi:peptidoglycan/LPS O-acetylase OafA/YrhL